MPITTGSMTIRSIALTVHRSLLVAMIASSAGRSLNGPHLFRKFTTWTGFRKPSAFPLLDRISGIARFEAERGRAGFW